MKQLCLCTAVHQVRYNTKNNTKNKTSENKFANSNQCHPLIHTWISLVVCHSWTTDK